MSRSKWLSVNDIVRCEGNNEARDIWTIRQAKYRLTVIFLSRFSAHQCIWHVWCSKCSFLSEEWLFTLQQLMPALLMQRALVALNRGFSSLNFAGITYVYIQIQVNSVLPDFKVHVVHLLYWLELWREAWREGCGTSFTGYTQNIACSS